ncbi:MULTISPECIES: hypothetical protein [unclassified Parabacteroides]|uniref:hypothetical protein n=1 Tax=unclassified Parabacteroides TaxID=2649774 RepID=UPI0013D85064|nr:MULTISPECIES: hypothetical protein [unclassified Parabacteroides]
MKKVIPFFIVCSILFVVACTSKHPPSQIGELICIEQLKNLPEDDSWNNKLVSFEGYFGFCRMINVVNTSSKTNLHITTEPNCGGDHLINARIRFIRAESKTIMGPADRNKIIVEKEINLNTLKVITDDYQKIDYQKFIFSGNLLYDNGTYYLDNVTIHLIQ